MIYLIPENTPTEVLNLLEKLGILDESLDVQRAAVEENWGQDKALLYLHDLELLSHEIPKQINNYELTNIVDYDSLTVTMAAFNLSSGEQCFIRFVRPKFKRDPVVIRRIEQGLKRAQSILGLVPMTWSHQTEIPFVLYKTDGVQLSKLLPISDFPGDIFLSKAYSYSIMALGQLQSEQLAANITTNHLILNDEDVKILWTDPIDGQPASLTQLCKCLSLLDPIVQSPITQLVYSWTNESIGAKDALSLLRRGLSDFLLSNRHRLALLKRNSKKTSKIWQTRILAQKLQKSFPPIKGKCCLRAGFDKTLYLIESDGKEIFGGAAASVPPIGLTKIFNGQISEPRTARLLIRSWNKRFDGDQDLREKAQTKWEGSDTNGEALINWLKLQLALRAEILVLEHRTSGGIPIRLQ